MKIEFVSYATSPREGKVLGALETGPGGVIVPTGNGGAYLEEFQRVREPDTGKMLTPRDGDAYLKALRHEFRSGYTVARVAGEAT